MSDHSQALQAGLLSSPEQIAEVQYTAEPPTLIYRTLSGKSGKFDGEEAIRGWAEFLRSLTARATQTKTCKEPADND